MLKCKHASSLTTNLLVGKAKFGQTDYSFVLVTDKIKETTQEFFDFDLYSRIWW